MKEQWGKIKEQLTQLWTNTSRTRKVIFFSVSAILLVLIVLITVLLSSKNFVPLYTNLSLHEVGQIKEELEGQNIPYEITDGGRTIKVPEAESERLLVELASKKIPSSGNIDYSFFSENSSWGITDNEFNMIKLDAMQTEIANLITRIDGIEDAEVRITLPQQSVFVNESIGEASAAIILHTAPSHEFKKNQLDSLYHLVSKSVPNLPVENIVIRNQYLEYYDLASGGNGFEDEYNYHRTVKREIEQDVQRRLHQMLGVMVGFDSVYVSVTADIDFTQENRQEQLVEPVDVESMEGLPISIENIRETFEGTDAGAGVVGTGDEDIPNYPAGIGGQDGDYELVKDTINYEINRINKDIVESPYKVRDLGIQVVVDSVVQVDGDDIQLLSQQEQATVEQGIASILNSIITTSIDKDYGENINTEEKISIVFQPFQQSMQGVIHTAFQRAVPPWIYYVGIALLIVIILLIFVLLRQRRKRADDVESAEQMGESIDMTEDTFDIPDILSPPKSEADIQREQLEKMAVEKPEDFAKLLRSWLSED